MTPKVYLDNCCLNPPFDDQSQARIRLESEAVLTVLQFCTENRWQWIGSDVLQYEVRKTLDTARRERVFAILRGMHVNVSVAQIDRSRVQVLRAVGFKAMDALHIACAEAVACDVLLTTDDGMISLASRSAGIVRVRVENPVVWLAEVLR